MSPPPRSPASRRRSPSTRRHPVVPSASAATHRRAAGPETPVCRAGADAPGGKDRRIRNRWTATGLAADPGPRGMTWCTSADASRGSQRGSVGRAGQQIRAQHLAVGTGQRRFIRGAVLAEHIAQAVGESVFQRKGRPRIGGSGTNAGILSAAFGMREHAPLCGECTHSVRRLAPKDKPVTGQLPAFELASRRSHHVYGLRNSA
jgi:hypothetical protein